MTRKRIPGRDLVSPAVIAEAARKVTSMASREGVRLAMIGGGAMQFYGSPRLTADVDFVATDPVRERGPMKFIKSLSFGGARYLYRISKEELPVDLIVREDEQRALYQEALDGSDKTDEGFRIVTPEYLAVIKFAAQRAKDHLDLLWLLSKGGVDVKKASQIAARHLGGSFAKKEFMSIVNEARWRAGEGEFEGKEGEEE